MDVMAAVDPRPNEIVGPQLHVFESFDRDEVMDILDEIEPDYWERYTRTDPKTMQIVYGIKWYKADENQGYSD